VNRGQSTVRVLLLSAAILVADQVTKMLVRGVHIPALGIQWEGVSLGASRPLLGDFLRLTHIENPGMAFGIEIGGKIFFAAFSLLASIGILYYLYRVRSGRLGFRISLAMILGGALGNLIDRVFYGVLFQGAPLFQGRVIDFLDLDFFDLTFFHYHLNRWPVFNIADACVSIGVVLLLVFSRSREEDLHPAPQSTSSETSSSPGDRS
jgi:signal peptidase II